MQKLTFAPNVPQLIALADPEGQYDTAAELVSYPTADGRLLVLNVPDATRLNMLDLQPGETFWVIKRVAEGQLPYLEISLSPATEEQRAAQESQTQPAPAAIPRRKGRTKLREIPVIQGPPMDIRIPPMPPRFFDQRGTGTHGPAPNPQPAPLSRPAAPIPFNKAFVEVVKLVRDGLESVGEQWSDASRQDAVSTVIIAGVNRGWIGPWERNNG